MSYKIFLDDERFPPNDGEDWYVARNLLDFANAIFEKGMPSFVSFDHDLGEQEPTGYDIAKYFVNLDSDELHIPEDFNFYVHSQNPVGKVNIESYLNNYLDFRKNKWK